MTGFDTGFFVELLRGNPRATEVWESLVEDEIEAVVSCLCLFELRRLGLKGTIRKVEALLESISEACVVAWLTPQSLSMAAKLSHGIGIPAMDALILASLLHVGCKRIYTTDKHLEMYSKKGIKIVNLRGFKLI